MLAYFGIAVGIVCLLAHQATFRRFGFGRRYLHSLVSVSLILGSVAWGSMAKSDREEDALRIELGMPPRR